jgi:hypothetical protein
MLALSWLPRNGGDAGGVADFRSRYFIGLVLALAVLMIAKSLQ